jgi:hypothetical protein
LKIEKILSLSKPATTTKKNLKFYLFIYLFFIIIFYFASARTHTSVRATRFLPRPRTVKTRPRVEPRPQVKRGRSRTSGRKGRLDGNFPPISSFMTSLSRPGESTGVGLQGGLGPEGGVGYGYALGKGSGLGWDSAPDAWNGMAVEQGWGVDDGMQEFYGISQDNDVGVPQGRGERTRRVRNAGVRGHHLVPQLSARSFNHLSDSKIEEEDDAHREDDDLNGITNIFRDDT